jgi:arylsulfatase
VGAAITLLPPFVAAAEAQKRPNIVMRMTDDTGWNDFGAYSLGGAGLGHPTPSVDQIAKEGPSSRTGTARPVAPRAGRLS